MMPRTSSSVKSVPEPPTFILAFGRGSAACDPLFAGWGGPFHFILFVETRVHIIPTLSGVNRDVRASIRSAAPASLPRRWPRHGALHMYMRPILNAGLLQHMLASALNRATYLWASGAASTTTNGPSPARARIYSTPRMIWPLQSPVAPTRRRPS